MTPPVGLLAWILAILVALLTFAVIGYAYGISAQMIALLVAAITGAIVKLVKSLPAAPAEEPGDDDDQ